MPEQRLADINWAASITGQNFSPSPSAWEDQVLYFLMLDRFSDGKEQGYRDNEGEIVTTGTTPLYQPSDRENAIKTEADAKHWREAGAEWVGGTLKGAASKIGYLKRLGVTAIWISPIFKQVKFQETYHGYGPQNFLDVDSHFGTRNDLKDLVATAHTHGLCVILDIILNHTGNVFAYEPDRYLTEDPDTKKKFLDPRWDGRLYRVKGYHDSTGSPSFAFSSVNPSAWPDGAIWPAELQHPATFTQKGRINNWDHDPEFIEGDFFDLKDIHLGQGHINAYQPSDALKRLCDVYKFWIAFADLDGFRVDTVKHMDLGAMRYFASVIHEFSEQLGKDNFYLIGEITGGRKRAFDTLEQTGIDAALGIDDIPDKLEYLVKGYRNPADYFNLFRNSLLIQKESHVWFKNKVVTVIDDHDQIRRGNSKARFCADNGETMVLNVLALNAMTLGIPCIYYGTEQCFDGAGGNDRYIREAMFGGNFGAFRSKNRHCFDENRRVYRELSKILALRARHMVLRRGRQYLREISGDGTTFGLPQMIGHEIRSVIPWSRIFDDREVLLAINSDANVSRTAYVVIDRGLHQDGATLNCIYSTEAREIGGLLVVTTRADRSVVELTVPPVGFVVYE